MRRLFALCVFLTFALAAYGQSLGDVARETRQKKKTRTKAAKKVVTNEDIPESPTPTPVRADASEKDPLSPSAAAPGSRTALQWRDAILMQKDRVETMRAHIEKLEASIHFVTANNYVNGAEYNQHQVRKQQEVKNLQKQMEEELKKLSTMQEAARQEGMGSAIYDPN